MREHIRNNTAIQYCPKYNGVSSIPHSPQYSFHGNPVAWQRSNHSTECIEDKKETKKYLLSKEIRKLLLDLDKSTCIWSRRIQGNKEKGNSSWSSTKTEKLRGAKNVGLKIPPPPPSFCFSLSNKRMALASLLQMSKVPVPVTYLTKNAKVSCMPSILFKGQKR